MNCVVQIALIKKIVPATKFCMRLFFFENKLKLCKRTDSDHIGEWKQIPTV